MWSDKMRESMISVVCVYNNEQSLFEMIIFAFSH